MSKIMDAKEKEELLKHNEYMKNLVNISIDVCYEAINDEGENYNIENLIKKLKLIVKGSKKGLDVRSAVTKK